MELINLDFQHFPVDRPEDYSLLKTKYLET